MADKKRQRLAFTLASYDYDEIRRLYIEEDLSIIQLSKRLNKGPSYLSDYLRYTGLLFEKHPHLSDGLVYHLFMTKKMRKGKIAQSLECSIDTIRRVIKRLNITREIDGVDLRCWYLEDGLTAGEISKKTGWSKPKILAQLQKLKIVRANTVGSSIREKLDNRGWLESQLKRKSARVIADELGCSQTTVFYAKRDHQIDSNHTIKVSKPEQQIRRFLKENGVFYKPNVRRIIHPLELDLFIPSHSLAIEVNGIYWHSERYKDKNYHFDKLKMCNDVGVELLQFWDIEIEKRPDVVMGILRRKLGIDISERVNARECVPVIVSNNEAGPFFDRHHIQGTSPRSRYIGLKSKDGNLVALMAYKMTGKVTEIVRYSTSCTVRGGFTKLLSKIPGKTIVTFSDSRISDGKLYKNSGFLQSKMILPDYSYFYKSDLYHKFNFRKERFKRDKSLVYDPTLTERELTTVNNIHRVYDAGKVKWELRR